MPAESSDNPALDFKDARVANEIAWPGRLVLLGLNLIPLAHFLASAGCAIQGWFLAATAVLYLAPPLLARIILGLRRVPEGRIPIGSGAFFEWWALFQLQVLFCRLPALEELLRLVPGLYSLWLRIWGARIGRLAYWSPGAFISDRSFLALGDDVVIGAGVRLIPHLLHRNAAGKIQLSLGSIKIGDRSIIGGYSILGAGTEIGPDESTRAALLSPPFTIWKNGRRVHVE